MSITYPVFLPDGITFKTSRFGLNFNKSQFPGEFVRNRISQSHGAGTTDRWEGIFTTPFLNKEKHSELTAWLNAMTDDDGTFFAFNPDQRALNGSQDDSNLLGGDAQFVQSMVHIYKGISTFVGVPLSSLGLKIGDEISFSALVFSTDALGVNLRVEIKYWDIDGVQVEGTVTGNNVSTSSTPTESKIDGSIIPPNTDNILVRTSFSSGSNNKAEKAILTRSSTAQTFVNYLRVSGAGQTGKSINIDGAVSGMMGVLRQGDYCQIGDQFFSAKERVDEAGGNTAVIELMPSIRSSPSDSEGVIIRNPVMIAQLVKTDHPQETNHNSVGVISFAWQEVV